MAELRLSVLGINYAPELTGIAPYTTGLAEGLAGRGHDVRVFTSHPHYPDWSPPDPDTPRVRAETRNGVTVTRFRHYVPEAPSALRRLRFEASFGRALRAADMGAPDVVICVSPALFSTAIALSGLGRPARRPATGLVVQDLYSLGMAETGTSSRLAGAMTRVEGRVLRGVDGVAVIHDRFKETVLGRFGVRDERVTVIRNWTHVKPVDPFDVPRMKEALGCPHGNVLVLHSGAMGMKQALENVVEAARLADQRAEPVTFVLLGDGSQRKALERKAEGIRSIRFVDPLEDRLFGRAIRSADVLLVNERPGVTDMAVPSKLTSYFSTGRPVLAATDAGSTTASEIGASGAGVRVDAGKPAVLLDAALELAREPERARILGQNGLRYCAEVLSEDAAIDAYEEWVRALAEKRRHDRG